MAADVDWKSWFFIMKTHGILSNSWDWIIYGLESYKHLVTQS
jgi:hypothetical protein